VGIKLGQEVQDRITGYKGIAIGITHYLQGCDRLLVQPKVGKDGFTIPEPVSFDEPDLIIIGEGILKAKEDKPKQTRKSPGGPRLSATKTSHKISR